MVLLSVIVPVYNVEKYLRRCIDSIINQTLKNIEIILINDGSSDNSLEICEEYRRKDSRIIVINKENGGVSSARNVGLDVAQGDWITFVDSDDYIEVDMYDILYKNAIKYDVQVSGCFFKYLTIDNKLLFNLKENHLKLNRKLKGNIFLELLYDDSYTNGLCVSMWNKIYKKDLFNQLRFLEEIKHEDDEICHKLYLQDITIYLDSRGLYTYAQNLNSLSNMSFDSRNLVFLEILNDRISNFDDFNLKALKIKSLRLYFNTVIEYYFKIKSFKIDYNFKVYKEIYKNYLLKYLFSVEFSTKERMRWFIFLLSPAIYEKLVLREKNGRFSNTK